MNPKIFRQYDIRGVVGVDLEPKDAIIIGKAFGTYILRKYKDNRIVVGHDNRYSSEPLNDYFVQGLISTGADITDIGLTLTPFLHFAVAKHQYTGGCMITASHNPKEHNGFKFDGPNFDPIYNDNLQEILELINNGDFEKGDGKVSYREIFDEYTNDIKNRINLQRRLKVVIDCGNGAASEFAPRLFESLGVEVIPQHCFLHGDFPFHRADPEQRINMVDSIMRVTQEEADVAVGFDTDGDRYGMVDEKGTMYANDMLLILLARDILRRFPGSKILYDVKSSYLLEEEIRKAGGIPQMIPTGHVYFKHQMKADNSILLGGEVSSHTFIRDNFYGFDDGLYAALRILELLSRSDAPFSEMFKSIPKTFSTEEIKLPTPDEHKFVVINGIKRSLQETWEIIDIDGVRVKFSDTSWALVRASNTSSNITLRFEADSEAKLKEAIEIIKSRLEQYPVVDSNQLNELL